MAMPSHPIILFNNPIELSMNAKTKIEHWCEGAIEAGWLAALVVAPMFFNVFSSRVFEPDKVSLVRSVALIMLMAWLIKLAAGGIPWLPAFSTVAGENNVDGDNDKSMLQRVWSVPFIIPILLLIVAYLLSTMFSVARFVSWWGSYQRLQGTYTFLSYVIIALLTMGHLRRPDQIRRLQHVIIMTSLPIAFYGIFQHYNLDPLPWGGDVSIRIAANAGNAIFLAAYLIMAVFLTMERIYSSFHFMLTSGSDSEGDSLDIPAVMAGSVYFLIFLFQLLAIAWTQSRGPWLGFFLGFYLFVLLLISALRPKRHFPLVLSWVGVGVLGLALIFLMNTSPIFEPLKSVPYVGRLTELLDFESRTAKVRTLIWQGAADMSLPHDALIFPDQSTDTINPLRPLVGYGPEAMWIAYNPFYPPELAHWEARNASPDRAHNETWDSIVVTGLLGFLAYMSLFIAIFYWSLRWLNLIRNQADTLLFALLLGGFSIGGIAFAYISDGEQWRLLGVALPAGLMFGLVLYLMVASFLHRSFKPNPADTPRQLLIIALLCTIVAHFVEIHFGIAIAATRTYFWIEAALLLTLGMRWAQSSNFAATQTFLALDGAEEDGSLGDSSLDGGELEETKKNNKKKSKQKASSARRGRSNQRTKQPAIGALPSTVMTDLLIFLTFVFIYTTNSQRIENPFAVIMNSIAGETPAIFLLITFTFLSGSTLSLAIRALRQESNPSLSWWLRGYGLYAAVVWGGWLFYSLIQSSRLGPVTGNDVPPDSDMLSYQLDLVAGHFALFTWVMVLWILGAGIVNAWPWLVSKGSTAKESGNRTLFGAGAAVVLGVLIFMIINSVNIGLVKADIIYKQGQQFDSRREWVNSIELYRRALQSRATEDHYMLFLGRSLLEQAKAAPEQGTRSLGSAPTFRDVLALQPTDISQMSQAELLRAAEIILEEAQRVNPLNTDHTANRARLYRTWADMGGDPAFRQEKLDQSLDQYTMATTLSPNAAHLWNEKGNAHQARGERELAEETYLRSLSIDNLFEQTYLLLAQFYNPQEEPQKVIDLLEPGIEAMTESRRHRPSAQMWSFLGVALAQLGDYDGAINANEEVLDVQPSNFAAMRNLAVLYRDAGQPEKSVEWGERALTTLGADDVQNRMSIHQFLIEAYRSLEQPENVAAQYEAMDLLTPNNASVLRALLALYQNAGNEAKITEVAQKLMAVEPDNYQYPFEVARSLSEQGQVDQARQFAERAKTLAPAEQLAAIDDLLATLE